LKNSRDLEDHFDRDQVRMLPTPDLATLPIEAANRLEQWIMLKETSIFVLTTLDFYSPLSDVAASVVELADKVKMPVISYFCSLDRSFQADGKDTRETKATSALVYALIR
jgi:hypothetical protein